MGKLIDLTGQRFGRLAVIERAENSKSGQARWVCHCECGNIIVAYSDNLRRKHTKSCGCLSQEKTMQRLFKHGFSGSRLYHTWYAMQDRCLKPHIRIYRNYGARGITVCEEWQRSFEAFRDWALSHGYADDLTIDRIDNNKGYCPENCRWVSYAEQAKNKRSTHLVEYNGKTQCVTDWAQQLSIGKNVLLYRLSHGWSIERALTTPVDTRKSHKRK